jgi:hypothetical protein
MTQKDLGLIEQARKATSIEWGSVFALADQADTEEAFEELTSIARALYHKEEAFASL